jgi:hypothetical protein
MLKKSVADAFAQFAGRVVSPPDKAASDATLLEIKKLAGSFGFSGFRYFYPGEGGDGTNDYSRINVRIRLGADLKYRVDKHFTPG